MGIIIIYMDFYYHRRDDMILLSMSPLILLFIIMQVDDMLKYLIVAMIVSNVTYWNCKNICIYFYVGLGFRHDRIRSLIRIR